MDLRILSLLLMAYAVFAHKSPLAVRKWAFAGGLTAWIVSQQGYGVVEGHKPLVTSSFTTSQPIGLHVAEAI
jgi:uncharacterized membrane protein YGL010W